jgi:hypothetical protein
VPAYPRPANLGPHPVPQGQILTQASGGVKFERNFEIFSKFKKNQKTLEIVQKEQKPFFFKKIPLSIFFSKI